MGGSREAVQEPCYAESAFRQKVLEIQTILFGHFSASKVSTSTFRLGL